MTQERDYYAILQVDPRAEPEVIQAAYRRLAAKYHPDVDHSPDATERMKLLSAAYEALSDPGRRRAYDRTRQPAAQKASPVEVSRDTGPAWWVLSAIISFVLALRFNPRFAVALGILCLVLWFVRGRR